MAQIDFQEHVNQLVKKKVPTDGARCLVTHSLSEENLRALWARKFLAIHVPKFFSPKLAKRAFVKISRTAKIENWILGSGKYQYRTDMNFGIGIPRLEAMKSRAKARRYLVEAMPAIRTVRNAFAPYLSPMDQLRLELSEIWPDGLEHVPFMGKSGLIGLVRFMRAETMFDNEAGKNGICHFDSTLDEHILSANLYLSVPKNGGKLCIWDVAPTRTAAAHPLVKCIHAHAFAPGFRDVIPKLLPPPTVITPKPGDLILLDTSRPHAVTGITSGVRASIQCFLTQDPATEKIRIWS